MGLGMVLVVALGAAPVHLQVGGLVVGLLEQHVGADAGVFQELEVLHRGGGDVDVHPPDGAVLELQGVDDADAVEDVVDGAVLRVLSGLQGQALVAHALQHPHFRLQLGGIQLAPGDVVVVVVAAVGTTVDAEVRKVERGEHDDPPAVDVFLDPARQGEDLPQDGRVLDFQQHGRLPVGEAAVAGRLLQEGPHLNRIGGLGPGLGQGLQDFLVVDEGPGFRGLGIIGGHGFLHGRRGRHGSPGRGRTSPRCWAPGPGAR